MLMIARNTDRSVLFTVQLRTSEPATQKTRQFVTRDFFVIRVHIKDWLEPGVTAHTIEEVIDERAYSNLAACRSIGGIFDTECAIVI